MIEVLIGAGVLLGVAVVLGLMGLLGWLLCEKGYKLLYYGGAASAITSLLYLIGYGVTHSSTNDPHWWPWIGLIGGGISWAGGYDQKSRKELGF